MFDDCWGEQILEQEVRRMATHAGRRGEQRPAAGSMEGCPAAKTKGKRCGPKLAKGVKRSAARMEERPTATAANRCRLGPAADPMPSAPKVGVGTGPKGG